MFLLAHVDPKVAEGKMAEAYGVFPPMVPVPEPLVMMSASPDLAFLQSRIIQYYMGHGKLDPEVLSLIRFLVANEQDYVFCVRFNEGVLKMAAGYSAEQIQAIRKDPETLDIDEPRKALVLFVLKAVKTPQAVTPEDIARLRGLGWQDRDIFDATYHGAAMLGPSVLYKAFVR